MPAGSEAGRRPRCPGVGVRHRAPRSTATAIWTRWPRVWSSTAGGSMWRSHSRWRRCGRLEGISERAGTYSGIMLDGEQLAAPLLRERPGASIPSPGAGAVRRLCAALRVLSAPHRACRRLSRATRRGMSRTIMGGAASILREGGEHGEHR